MADFVIGEKTSVSMKTLLVLVPFLCASIWSIGATSFKAEANAQDIAKIKSEQNKFQHVVIKHLSKIEVSQKIKGNTAFEDFESEDEY